MRWIRAVLFTFLLLTGCASPQTEVTEAEEIGHELEVTYTFYDEKYEWFVVTEKLEKGLEVPVLVHITRLKDFKPITEGTATLELNTGGSGMAKTQDSLAEPGIFSFTVMPPESGIGDMVIRLNAEGIADSVRISNIAVHPAGEREESPEEISENTVTANSIAFTKEQSWQIDFATEQVTSRPFGTVITATAQVQTDLIDATVIPARTSGIVVFSGDVVLEGSPVYKGQSLFIISGTGMAEDNAAIRYNEARNNFNKAESDFLRIQTLRQENIASEKDYLQAANDYENAKLLYESLQENFTEVGEVVVCPLTGYINHSFVVNGQYVDAGQPLLSVYGNRDLILRAEVPQEYFPLLADISEVTLYDPVSDRHYTLEEIGGSLLSHGRSTTDNSLLVPVMFRIRNNGTFIPGGFLEVFMKAGKSQVESLVVPMDALIEEMGNFFIYVQHNPETFEKRQVQRGDTDGIYVEITEGLSDGERIVTRGAIMVKLSSTGGNLDPHAGHIH